MIYVLELDMMLFLCFLSVINLDDLYRKGFYLSDIFLYDVICDFVLLFEWFEVDYKLVRNFEVFND